MNDHEKLAGFRRMARGEASPTEARKIVRHLLAGCARCAKLADKVRLESGDSSAWDYETSFDRVQERVARVLTLEDTPLPQPQPMYAAAH